MISYAVQRRALLCALPSTQEKRGGEQQQCTVDKTCVLLCGQSAARFTNENSQSPNHNANARLMNFHLVFSPRGREYRWQRASKVPGLDTRKGTQLRETDVDTQRHGFKNENLKLSRGPRCQSLQIPGCEVRGTNRHSLRELPTILDSTLVPHHPDAVVASAVSRQRSILRYSQFQKPWMRALLCTVFVLKAIEVSQLPPHPTVEIRGQVCGGERDCQISL